MINNSKLLFLTGIFLFSSCTEELPIEEGVFDNPLDENEVDYETPAITFFPIVNDVVLGSSFIVSVFILAVEDLGGSYIKFSYDKQKLEYLNDGVGAMFDDAGQSPLCIVEVDENAGSITLNTSFLGSDSTYVNGTGSLVDITFRANSTGTSGLIFDPNSELVTPNDDIIEIKYFGEGVVNAL